MAGAACAALAVPAFGATAIPGATYNGTLPQGGTLTFTVSADGTLVASYAVSRILGNGCVFTGGGVTPPAGPWPGAPIVGNTFSYAAGTAIVFQGTFSGAQTATGTVRFSHPAGPGGVPAACDTGTVSWTASTTSTPPSGGGGGNGGNNNNNGNSGKHHFTTRLKFRRMSLKLDGGQVLSATKACRAGRQVILWHAKKRIGKTKATKAGKFSFRRTSKLRGHSIRASVAARTVGAGICMAGSSTFIAG